MNPLRLVHFRFIFLFLFYLVCTVGRAQTQNCEATTLDQFYDCYGGTSAFSQHSQEALSTFIQAEDAITSENYTKAKTLLDDLFYSYPIGDQSWRNVWARLNGSNIGSPHGYYGLRMMNEIVDYHLNKSSNIQVKKANMKVILVGCSEGIQPTTDAQLENRTGAFITNSMDPKLRENNYRIVKQSLDLFLKYVTAITKGKLEIELEIIELPNLCIPVSVSTTKPYLAYSPNGLKDIWQALDDDLKAETDWWWLMYPSHVPDYPDFDDDSFITGGMGLDYKGGPAFISDDKWIVRKPIHHGGGDYSDIERRAYLPMWFQHEFFHHLYRAYPEYQLEVNGHDWFNRNFWPSDFEGQFENDFYTESLHKRLQLDCIPLEVKLITSVGSINQEYYNDLSNDEFIGTYSLDKVENNWHIGQIIKQNNKYYWKNNANIQWEVTPKLSDGILETGSDSPYPGVNFNIKLYQVLNSGDYIPGVTGLQFQSGFYRKRFDMLNNDTVPFEITLGNYYSTTTSGEIIKESGALFWNTQEGKKWLLTPNAADESFVLANDSPTPTEKFELIAEKDECFYDIQGFKYLGNYYTKSEANLTEKNNVAPYGIATQSSDNYTTDGLADLAIDGYTGGLISQKSVTHTQKESTPWWQVRLQQDYEIKEIKIWNRTDCCSTRLSNFDVFVYNEAGTLVFKETIVDSPNTPLSIIPNGAKGARVRIKLKGTEYLSLAEVAVYVNENTLATAIPNAMINTTMIYPNPSGNQLTIDLKDVQDAKYSLIDGTGKRVLSGSIQKGTATIDSSPLKSGLYFLQINSAKGNYTQKVVKN